MQYSVNSTSVKEKRANRFDTNKRWYFPTQNVAMLCSSLPQDIVEGKRLCGIKKTIRKIHRTK